MDEILFYAINSGLKNRLFDRLMPLITDYNSWKPVIFALFAYLVWKKRMNGVTIILVVLVAAAISDMINHRVLKELFARVRPCNALENVHLLTGCSGSFSFPSSHAVNSFTIASVLGFYNRGMMPYTLFCAAMVALSRVYLGVHYPMDVTVGAFVGVGIGYAFYRIAPEDSMCGINPDKKC
jgi:undecaprenyl-diphosphatase